MICKTQGWKHQVAAYEFAASRTHTLLNMAMGTGKSRVVVNLIADLNHRSTLILCPTSVMNVWPREFNRHAEPCPPVLVLNKGSCKTKTALADDFLKRNPVGVVVINYESAWRAPFAQWALSRRWDLVGLDESQRTKSPTGKVSRFCDKLRPHAGQRLCLSGTPLPHSMLDAFAQCRFLNPDLFGRWYTHFRARYAITNPLFPSQVVRWINQEEFAEKLASVSFTVGSEVLDLPPALHEVIPVELCPKAKKIYRDLEEEFMSEVDSGIITVSNALVKLLRLQQLTSGSVQLNDGPVIEVDTAKIDALSDLLEDLPRTEPVVVFAWFRRDLQLIQRVAEKLGRRYGEVSGQRNDLNENAMMPEDVDLLGVQEASGGVGVDFTRAAYCIYFSIGYSLGAYEQSLARCHRPGQTRTVRYYHLTATKTVDEIVYAALEKKKEVVEYVLHGYKNRNPNLSVI